MKEDYWSQFLFSYGIYLLAFCGCIGSLETFVATYCLFALLVYNSSHVCVKAS